MTCPSHPYKFHHMNNIWWSPQVLGLLIMHPSSSFSLLGPNILLTTLFSNTLNLHSTLSVRPSFTPTQDYR
jgi:hypothetical protein